jgi:phosphatidylglycerophosphate synthase
VLKIPPKARLPLRVTAVVLSTGLFAYLVWRFGPSKIWENVRTLGWGFAWVLALAGVSHLTKTWAWQLTLGPDKNKILFSRLVGLRMGAEAAGQLGIVGQTFGDSLRVAKLGPTIPIANGLASVTLDRGLYIVTGAMITIAGILAALPVLSLSHALRLYASLFMLALILFLLLTLLVVRKRLPVASGFARIVGRIPSLRNWIEERCALIQSVENALFDFHHNSPKAFWASFSLILASHCMAVMEVCLVLWLMRVKIGLSGALVIEGLTKVVSVVGNFNPGNIGTYEGGNILIGKLFALSGATGLALGFARRLRSFFWAGVGLVCLFFLTKTKKHPDSAILESTPAPAPIDATAQADSLESLPPVSKVAFVIFLANGGTRSSQISSAITRVGSLPILLRTILAAKKINPSRIMIVIDPAARRRVQRNLFWTGRLPESVQWMEAGAGMSFPERLRLILTQAGTERLVLVDGNKNYHPSLLRKAGEWSDEDLAMVPTSGDQPVGIYALSANMIRDLAEHCPTQMETLEELRARLVATHSVVCTPVPEYFWQRVSTPEDGRSAEQNLDRWLVKPTDGIYARLNRKISIPISRQLIKFPITPNMVSIFTLGVGIASASFFACGGYWNTLLGAFLCLAASVLDGCDGEVARLKLLESDFGCWLETVCDYLFYLFLFIGMTIGIWRSSGSRGYLVYGGLLLFGALASFLATAWERHRLASARPEQLLKIWQTHAESRPSNPFLYLGRHMEFITRRCFFPYALLCFALLNIMSVAFVLSVIGANLVWPIALYSSHTFAGAQTSQVPSTAASA